MYKLANRCFHIVWRLHQRDRYTLSMSYLILGFAAFLLLGCSTIRYKENGAEFERMSFGTQTQISRFSVSRDAGGRITFNIEGLQSDQVEAIKAAAEGAAKGLAEGARP
jgi:hypothetical protein